MNLEELKQKAEAVAPRRWIGQWTRWGINGTYAGAGPTCVTAGEARTDAEFIAAANPQTVLALVKVAEALNACDSLSPWEQIGDSFTEQCRECGSDRPRHYESRPAHFDFCPWPKLVKAREELEAME